MNSSFSDSISVRTTQTGVSRYSRPETGRLKRNAFYLWLFGHMHAKRLLIYSHLIVTTIAVWGLIRASTFRDDFEPVSIPGLDGRPLFWTNSRYVQDFTPDSVIVTLPGPTVVPFKDFAHNLLNFFSYFYLLSVGLSFYGLHIVEKVWFGRRPFWANYLNPAVLLIPFLVSMISFSVPLLIWSIRTLQAMALRFVHLNGQPKTGDIMDAARFCILPILISWVFYLYFLYGVTLSFVYVWKRSPVWKRRKVDSRWKKSSFGGTILWRRRNGSGNFGRGLLTRISRNGRSKEAENHEEGNVDGSPLVVSTVNEVDKNPPEAQERLLQAPPPDLSQSFKTTSWCVRHLDTVEEEIEGVSTTSSRDRAMYSSNSESSLNPHHRRYGSASTEEYGFGMGSSV
ncbi:unnamed protein product [Caenorhabditis auriculariae]|uniref:Uncharacterized protein n=1 Tax=Caenorhabditis auriculariae TaxID=2777116 RepID=A0A8S1GNX0_9PELO|nr:unnamed protein product [Caenorhabditis auriculariae]